MSAHNHLQEAHRANAWDGTTVTATGTVYPDRSPMVIKTDSSGAEIELTIAAVDTPGTIVHVYAETVGNAVTLIGALQGDFTLDTAEDCATLISCPVTGSTMGWSVVGTSIAP